MGNIAASRWRLGVAGGCARVGETALAVVDELPVVASVMRCHLDNPVCSGIQHLAGWNFRPWLFQAGPTGTHDEFAYAIGVIYAARCVLGRESLVPVGVTIQDDVSPPVVEVLPELLHDGVAARAGCGGGPAWILVVREGACSGVM